MERIQLVDVVIAGKHGGSIRLSVPAWICKKLGIRPGDRFAVYLTYDDEAGTEAILYVPVGRGSRSDDDSPARREGGRIIIADYVLGQESSSQPSSGAHGAEGLTAKRQSQEPRLMCDGGEPENVFTAIAAILNAAGHEQLGTITIQITALDKPHLGLYGRWLVRWL